VLEPQGLTADALQPEVDMLDAQFLGTGQSGLGERTKRKGREGRIDLMHPGHPTRGGSANIPPGRSGSRTKSAGGSCRPRTGGERPLNARLGGENKAMRKVSA